MQREGIYPGTYLKTEPFELRYKIVGDFLKDKIEKPIVVDLNCGEPLFRKHIDYKEYYANDLYAPESIDGINFRRVSDSEIDIKSDLLVMFGCSAGEYTEHELESKTATESFVRLSKYNPEYIVFETSPEWEKRYGYITKMIERLEGYSVVFQKTITIPPGEHYHDTRVITILKK